MAAFQTAFVAIGRDNEVEYPEISVTPHKNYLFPHLSFQAHFYCWKIYAS